MTIFLCLWGPKIHQNCIFKLRLIINLFILNLPWFIRFLPLKILHLTPKLFKGPNRMKQRNIIMDENN